jgi:hypothetical protein
LEKKHSNFPRNTGKEFPHGILLLLLLLFILTADGFYSVAVVLKLNTTH